LSGAASEQALAGEVQTAMQQPSRNLAGATSMTALMELLARAAVVVAGDTGPLHVAAALGAPLVGLFGPTDPVNTGPQALNGEVVRINLPCSPCYDLRSPADCKLPDRSLRCMWELTPELALAAVERVLDRAQQTADSEVESPLNAGAAHGVQARSAADSPSAPAGPDHLDSAADPSATFRPSSVEQSA
jgi:ADP-heptose:LPS heptosyltransferase